MGRPILGTNGGGLADVTLFNSGGVFLLSTIFLSISLISMVVFACSDSHKKKKKYGGGGGCGGDGGRGGGCGGDGGGGGGC